MLVYLFLRIRGRPESALFPDAAVFRSEVDAAICHVTLAELEQLTGLPGVAEVSVVFVDAHQVDALAAVLAGQMSEDEVLTWREVLPAMGGDAAGDKAFSNLFIGIVIAEALLGVTSPQLPAMLERLRGRAVLLALGMTGTRLLRLEFAGVVCVAAVLVLCVFFFS